MNTALEKLSHRGYKITPQRKMILEVMQDSDRHLTAEEIADRVKEMQPNVSVATVYRNINLLVEIELLSRLDIHNGPARYESFKGHDHHMVCLNCGNVIKLGICPMKEEIVRLANENGFKIDSHHFEVTGYCRECQEKFAQKQQK